MFKFLSSTHHLPKPAVPTFSISVNDVHTIAHVKELEVILTSSFFLRLHSIHQQVLWTLSPKCTPGSSTFLHLHCYHSRAKHCDYWPRNGNSLLNWSSYNPFSAASETSDKSKSNISFLCIKPTKGFFTFRRLLHSLSWPKRPLLGWACPHLWACSICVPPLATLAFSCSLNTPISFAAKEDSPGQRPWLSSLLLTPKCPFHLLEHGRNSIQIFGQEDEFMN